MVTSYYIMNIGKSRKHLDFTEHINNLNKTATKISISSCRVCLHEGSIELFSKTGVSDILESLQHICSIVFNKSDNLPKYLCTVCYKFIKDAIAFRVKAKQTEKLLTQPIKEERDSEDSFERTPSKNENSDHEDYNSLSNHAPDSDKEPVKHKSKAPAKVQCEVCNAVINKSYYNQHLTMHDPNHYKYVCDVCGKSFRLRCAYHSHSLRHNTDFIHKCQICPYKGRYKELLKNHMKVHTADYKYMCTECPSRFLFRSNLNRHLLRHKEPKFHCDTCNRPFHIKLALQRHYEADHLGIKNHVCNLCGKAFGYRNAMMKHQRCVHKREKIPFSRMPAYLQDDN